MMKTMILLILIIALSVSAVVLGDDDVATRCPTGLPSTTVMKLYDDICYQFVSEEKYWNNARDYCLSHGGRLVKIDDPQTNQFIVNSLNQLWWRNKGVWIGLHDIGSEMNFQWTGYELYQNEAVLWTNWGRGHPGAFLHSRRDCVRMVRDDGWKWHETLCNTMRWHYRFICEYKATSVRAQINSHLPASGNRILESSHDEVQLQNDDAAAERQLLDHKTLNDSEKSKNGNGIVVAAVCCVLIGAVVAIALFMYYRRRRRLHGQREDSVEGFASDKGKDFDSVTFEPKDSTRTKAIANIYVDADTKGGHVTTRLAPKTEPEVKEMDDDDEKELEQEALRNSTTEESIGSGGVEFGYDKPMPKHIYAEIPEKSGDDPETSHIYEALDDIKK